MPTRTRPSRERGKYKGGLGTKPGEDGARSIPGWEKQ